jgi:uncharacterized membrane protein YhhN
MSFRHKQPMGTFRRGMTVSPFQIPLLAYLFIEGILASTQVHAIAGELGLERDWPVWNFVIVLIVGAGLATFSRFNGNERLESFSLYLVSLAILIAGGIQITAHQYGLGDEIALLIGCAVRIRVLGRSRKAERTAIQIVNENNEGEQN